jgi:hypothetical protein
VPSTALLPELAFCAEKQRLITAFTLAASEYLHAQSEQLRSVARGDRFGFEAEIKAASKRKDAAKRAILKHQSEHGC